MTIAASLVKELRKLTGSGMMDCKKALEETNGDLNKAIEILRKKGLAGLARRAGRISKEGLVDAYIHPGGRIGVLLEVNCETDFVARNQDFREFVHDIAMQVAASNPLYLSREDVPEDLIEAEKVIYRDQALAKGKPEKVLDKIVAGQMENFFKTVCLLEQTFVKNPDITVGEYLGEIAGKIGENINIRRFVRFHLGEEI